jgi:aromatic-L-amino-acid decarboxylase
MSDTRGEGPEPSATTDLATAVQTVLPALAEFARYRDGRAGAALTGWKGLLQEGLPRQGAGPDAVLALLRDVLIPNGLRTGAPGFCGWVTTAPTAIPVVAALAASVAGSARMLLQPFSVVEDLALRWLKELLGIPLAYQGLFVSGGAIANLIGLGAARQWAYERHGLDPAEGGVAGLPEPRIYTSSEAHRVVHRAAAVLGLGRRAVVEVPVDVDFRLDVGALRELLQRDRAAGCTPIAVVATAGTVNTGAVDPIAALVELCREEGLWLHVDGAYGLPAVLDPETAPLFAGVAAADSLVVDPHKWLATPVGCGAAFVRDRDLQARAFRLDPADYLDEFAVDEGRGHQVQELGLQFHHLGLEQTAPARGVAVWALLKEVGAEGVRARVRRHNGFARRLAERVRVSPVLELLAPVTLSICCFRYVPPELRGPAADRALLNRLNRQVLRLVQGRGRCTPSGTVLGGAFAIRACYINPRTTAADVDALAEEVERCGALVWERLRRRAAG